MNVAVMGYGTVGSGVVEILHENREEISKRAGFPIEVKKVLVRRDFSRDSLISDITTKDYMDIVNDEDIDIVVEAMGGLEPAYTYVKAMLNAKKHVTTSNKALVAEYGHELMEIARENSVNFQMEASVAGGIPIIRPLAENLSGEKIELIEGIINGTTNYILTRMSTEEMPFDVALKEAQDLGYAEADPTNDVEGFDVSRKIAILTSIASGRQVDFKDIPVEGISRIELLDFKYAQKLNREIKLIARTKRVGDTYIIRVAPYMISISHPLSNVNYGFNGIFITGNMVGDLMFYGSGAGKLPTASAVVGDIVDMARNVEKNLSVLWSGEKLKLANALDTETRFFLRAGDNEIQKAIKIEEIIDVGISGEKGYVTALINEREFFEKVDGLSDISGIIRLA